MGNTGKTLVDRIRSLPSTIKKSFIYVPVMAAGLALPSYSHAQTRETLAQEYFTGGVITSNYLAEDPAKWEINSVSEKLQVKDFDEDWGDTETFWGYTRFSLTDTNTLVKMTEKNASLEAVFNVSEWNNGGGDEVGFCIGDPTMLKNGTYYTIGINSSPNRPRGSQIRVRRVSPGFSEGYFFIVTNLIPAGTKNIKLKFSHDANGYHLFLNDKELDANSTAEINKYVPAIEGYPIMMILDASYADEGVGTTTTIDDIFIEADAAGGGSLGQKRIRQNLLGKGGQIGRAITPQEIPHRFRRGDSNMDKAYDISDGINTLLHLYLGQGNVRCPDSADTNDDGILDLSDAIFTFNSLFVDPNIKLPPPNMIEKDGKLIMDAAEGIDTTEDKLPNCEGY